MSKHTTVYSPQGEMFETSSLNAHDLVTHANWSYDQPTVAKAEPAEEPAPEVDEDEAVEDEAEDTSDDDAAEDDEPADDAAPFTTEEQFAELTTTEDVTAYLAKHFPDFKPHHLAKRDGLVAKAIELAAA